MKMKDGDASHVKLIKAVEAVTEKTRLEQKGNPSTLGALAVKIMARQWNRIKIPAAFRKKAGRKKPGYRHWQDVMVQLFRQSKWDGK